MEKGQLIDKLFSLGAHFGYSPARRHPSTARFIFGAKGGVEFFDLEQTAACFAQALEFIKTLAAERKTILFVGGKAEARESVQAAAQHLGAPFVAGRWIGGTLTNWQEIKKRLSRLSEIFSMREKGELAKFTKLERLRIDREAELLEGMFGGLVSMTKLPDTLVVVDPKREEAAAKEARQLGIPVVALLNTDCDRSLASYPVPLNDASRETIRFALDEIVAAYSSALAPTPAEQ